MFVLASASLPPPEKKKGIVDNVKRVKRQMESKRLQQIKKIQESAKVIADEEVQYIKSLLPKEFFDIDEE